jgi:hypothetical protein
VPGQIGLRRRLLLFNESMQQHHRGAFQGEENTGRAIFQADPHLPDAPAQ